MVKCSQIRETFFDAPTPEVERHLAGCPECAREFKSLRATMSALDDWRAPEPSSFFGVRIRARLDDVRNEPAGWFAWLRRPLLGVAAWRPALATALAVAMAVGVILTYRNGNGDSPANITIAKEIKGTAVGALLVLEKEHEIFTELELLDDLNGDEYQNEL
jgi:anti-sigma-K factor RskA